MKKKIILNIIFFTLFPLLLIGIMVFIIFMPPRQGIEATLRCFERNKSNISIIRDYFYNLDHDYLRYPPFSGERGVLGTRTQNVYVEISDTNVKHALDILLRRGYQIISKDNDFIIFLRWRGINVGRGIIYSTNGITPDESVLPFLTKIESISYDNWFYYEEDFNEWRRRNREN